MAETVANHQVPEHYVKLYTDNVRAELNKRGGLLAGFVSSGAYYGEKAQVVNFLGPVEFTERNTPYGDTQLTELAHTQRWVTGAEYDCAILIDRLDELKMLYDPTSAYVERMREAAARKMDEIIMSKFYAKAKSGKDGTTDTEFNPSNVIVHDGARLSVEKLIAARKLLKQRHVDLQTEMPCIAVTAEQVADLMNQTQVVSSDYNALKPLVEGEVRSFMGFNFVFVEDNGTSENGKGIPTRQEGADTIRECPVWVHSGMHFGQWDSLAVTINERSDKNNIKQLHATFTAGATRLEENKILKLECVE